MSLVSPILQIENVTRQFPKTPTPAVTQVSLTLHPGEILGLLGPSGCGKTTLLRLIAGFEPLQSGHITLAGQIVAGNGHWVSPERRDMGMVFQDYALFPHLSVAKNIAFGLAGQKVKADPVLQTLALVGLKGLENRYPHELSGGQQQRVALARALARRPSLILLDEPLSNLDVQVRLHLRREIREILKDTHTTAIFVTHDQEEALAICDQVAVMHQGKIEQLDNPEALYRYPASRFVAEFVTQANFLSAQRHSSIWQTEVGSFSIKQDLAEETGALMIRQEDLKLHPSPESQIVVRDRHFLGRDYAYWVQTPSGTILQARLSSGTIAVGDRVNCLVNPDAVRLFPSGQQPS
ncbi:MAG: ABC transporter ATP-binding protein [Timaviella obliquedivisa GSE-PSE-MK23-08B]|nr:ABC transporter ATP-binding protein [Timaviella obliquedivisa GSE-PSE-MK23-08B]